ncbi:SCO family protein [Falsibacillus albus]|uniref:SCO family protein n=1 Tax=Falsibacillus albus TaxID=2478915 RepID=A0A3L7K350_9BACI|nr:SCO family protein [Falsibacillus albus]RLQ97537.1 SCO family protein [Falsibacillus albus]
MLLMAAGCSSKEKGTPLKDFKFTDENNQAFGLKDMKGKVWITDFVFTSCTSVCPPMTHNMSELQKMVKKEGLKDVGFVSFSVDPTVDTPQGLKEYAAKYDADLATWHFLTGYSQDKIQDFALDNFQALVKKPKNDDQVIHGTSFYLINKNGERVKSYSGVKDVPFDQIIKDIKDQE